MNPMLDEKAVVEEFSNKVKAEGRGMQYSYLANWAKDAWPGSREFKALERYEDMYRISFKKNRAALMILLTSRECFCFWQDGQGPIPFAEAKGLNLMQDALRGTRLGGVEIMPGERIVVLIFEKTDIYNQNILLHLVLELIPRYQNLILTKVTETSEQILDAVRKVSFAENRHRQILPGMPYVPPPSSYQNVEAPVNWPVLATVAGIRENADVGDADMNTVFARYFAVLMQLREKRLKADARKKIEKQIKKLERKRQNLESDLFETQGKKQYQRWAELLKSQVHTLRKGMASAVVTDYFSEDLSTVEIPLNQKLSPHENVQFYFKKYRKARDGKMRILEQIAVTDEALEHKQRELFDVEDMDVYAIKKQKKNAASDGRRGYKSVKFDGAWELCVGRTSKENDELTTRYAKPGDMWFHTRVFRGTHVILRNFKKQEVPEWLIILSAQVAAYFSKAKKSTNVPVDYTQIRYVRKPHGSAAGFVTYTHQKTLYVDPRSFRDAVHAITRRGLTLQE